MKSLNIIQTISKIAKILSKIVFVFCVVGACFCVVGIVCLALFNNTVEIGGVSIHSIVETDAKVSLGTAYTNMAVGLIICIGEAVLAKFAEKYFKNELAAGTPFTFDGAKELLNLGILSIAIPIGLVILTNIVNAVMGICFSNIEPLKTNDFLSNGLEYFSLF